ncbi:MAG: hypothetical protein M3P13_08135, partial [Acidobacteriota bacterium]|nr:hypothetical protein [Acidobacteriota bacterium]
MSYRRVVPAFVIIAVSFSVVFFGLGNYLGARQNANSDERIAALRAEVDFLRQRELQAPTGTTGRLPGAAAAV